MQRLKLLSLVNLVIFSVFFQDKKPSQREFYSFK
jgi:hypothetical protein